MNVLIFGGTGFVGRSLAAQLGERGHDVAVLTRNPNTADALRATGVTAHVGDLLQPAQIRPALGSPDAIVLLAAPRLFGKRLGERRLESLKREITAIYTNAIGIARHVGCPIVITGGTSFRTAGADVADERRPLARFGATRIGEDIDPLVERVVADGEPRLVWLWPGQIYGPGGMFLIMVDWLRRGRYRLLGDGANYVPRIHVDDCAAAYAAAVEHLDRLETGVRFIVADDVACTTREFMEHLADLLDVERPSSAPPWLVRLIVGKALFETATMNCRVSNAKIKRELGWRPHYPSYREGLPEAVREILASRTPEPAVDR